MITEGIEGSSTSIVDISTNSDIILFVGRAKKQLQVNSCVLKTASKVFNAMFGPQIKEGQNLHGSSPSKELFSPKNDADTLKLLVQHCPQIKMHEDEVQPMETILKTLHFQGDTSCGLTAEDLVGLAIHSDKYDCVDALGPWISHWFHKVQNEPQFQKSQSNMDTWYLRHLFFETKDSSQRYPREPYWNLFLYSPLNGMRLICWNRYPRNSSVR
jgi:hypothetical protein